MLTALAAARRCPYNRFRPPLWLIISRMTLLVPERMLVFSPDLAVTIGLEEAVLLHLLHDLSVAQIRPAQPPWFVIEVEALEQLLPFWDRRALQRICKNLADQGVIHIDSAPLTEAAQLRLSLSSRRH